MSKVVMNSAASADERTGRTLRLRPSVQHLMFSGTTACRTSEAQRRRQIINPGPWKTALSIMSVFREPADDPSIEPTAWQLATNRAADLQRSVVKNEMRQNLL